MRTAPVAKYSRAIYGVSQPALADIVVTESYPADYDLWQAAKGIYAAELAVREGGVVILVTPCPHGVSTEHPEVEQLGYHGFAEVKSMVEKNEITDLVAAAHLVHVGRVVCAESGARHSSFTRNRFRQSNAARIQIRSRVRSRRSKKAFKFTSPQAKVVVLRHGGDVLPVVNV